MSRLIVSLIGLAVLAAGVTPGEAAPSRVTQGASGREALSVVRHDWKPNARATIRAEGRRLSLRGAVPAGFRSLSAEGRMDYLHARRNLSPSRFDGYHPLLGRIMRRDDRLRGSLGQGCEPLDGLLPDTSYWRFLRYRRGLAPRRFDYYHPALGAILARDSVLRSGAPCPPIVPPPPLGIVTGPTPESQLLNPPGVPSAIPAGGGSSSSGSGGGGGPGPAAVPEPASLALMLVGGAGAIASRLLGRSRRRTGLRP